MKIKKLYEILSIAEMSLCTSVLLHYRKEMCNFVSFKSINDIICFNFGIILNVRIHDNKNHND